MSIPAESLKDHAYVAAVDSLEVSVDLVMERALAALRREVPIYERIDDDSMRESMRLNIGIACRVLRTGMPLLTPELRTDLDKLIRGRIEASVSSDEMIHGHHLIMGTIHALFAELAEQMDMPSFLAVRAPQLLWQASNLMLQRAFSAIQERSLQVALRETQARTNFIRKLVSGELDSPTLQQEALTHGLDLTHQYFPVRARPAGGHDGGQFMNELVRRYSDGNRRGLMVLLDRECVGVLPRKPSSRIAERVALGPPRRLDEIAGAFAAAAKLARWMDRRDERGTRSIDEVTWRMLVDDEPLVTELLLATYLQPLDKFPALRPLLIEALQAFLDNDRNVPRAAEALVVHANTLRYRLRKYAEITGVSVEKTEHLVALAWVLETQRVIVVTNNEN